MSDSPTSLWKSSRILSFRKGVLHSISCTVFWVHSVAMAPSQHPHFDLITCSLLSPLCMCSGTPWLNVSHVEISPIVGFPLIKGDSLSLSPASWHFQDPNVSFLIPGRWFVLRKCKKLLGYLPWFLWDFSGPGCWGNKKLIHLSGNVDMRLEILVQTRDP